MTDESHYQYFYEHHLFVGRGGFVLRRLWWYPQRGINGLEPPHVIDQRWFAVVVVVVVVDDSHHIGTITTFSQTIASFHLGGPSMPCHNLST